MSKVSSVGWAANEFGYVVQWYDQAGQVVNEYHAGNHKLESTTYVDPNSEQAESPATLRRFALNTALEMAEEFCLTSVDVSEDTDLAAELEETYRSFGPEEDNGEEESEASSGGDDPA